MKALLEKRDVPLGLVAEELGAPDPRLAGSGSLRQHEKAGAAVHFEIETFEAVPLRLLHNRCRRRIGFIGKARKNHDEEKR
jgi:hypothetical protein